MSVTYVIMPRTGSTIPSSAYYHVGVPLNDSSLTTFWSYWAFYKKIVDEHSGEVTYQELTPAGSVDFSSVMPSTVLKNTDASIIFSVQIYYVSTHGYPVLQEFTGILSRNLYYVVSLSSSNPFDIYALSTTLTLDSLTNFKVGETPSTKDITSTFGRVFHYADGTNIADGKAYTTSCKISYSDNNKVKLASVSSSLTGTITVETNYLGTITKTVYCSKSSSNIASRSLTGAISSFNVNSTVSLGDGAVLHYYDSSSNEIDTYTGASEIANVLSSHTYTNVTSLTDDEQTETYTDVLGGTFTQKYFITYDEATLGVSPVSDTQIIDTSVSGAKVDLSKFTITKYRHSNGALSSSTVLDHSALTFSDYTLDSNSVKVDVTATYSNDLSQTLTGSMRVNIAQKAVSSYSVTNGTDDVDANQSYYYSNNLHTFAAPTGLAITATYNDGTTASVDLSALTYYLDSACSNPISIGSTIDNSSYSGTYRKIYFKSTLGDAVGYYDIKVNADSIKSVSVASAVTVYLGNTLLSLASSIPVTATYQDSAHAASLVSGYSINESGLTLSSDSNVTGKCLIASPSAMTIAIGSSNYDLNGLSNVTFSKPSIKSVTLTFSSSFKTSYNSGVDSIDLSNGKVLAKVAYNNASFTRSNVIYGGGGTSDETPTLASKFKCWIDDSTDPLDGSKLATLSSGTEATYTVHVAVVSDFDSSYGYQTTTIAITAITNVTGIAIVPGTVKSQYYVGDTFLDESDTTEVIIYFTSNGSTATKQMKLNSGNAVLNIYPTRGTKFIGTNPLKMVSVRSITDSNVAAFYDISVSQNEDSTSKTETITGVPLKLTSDYEFETKKGKVTIYSGSYILIGTAYFDYSTYGLKSGYYLASKYDDDSNQAVIPFGMLDDDNKNSGNSKVILFFDPKPVQDGISNIIVKFPSYTEGDADFINNAHICTLFGHNNEMDTLWLSGNKDNPNYDIHSTKPNESYNDEAVDDTGDFSYFSERDKTKYGQTDNAIVGYDIVSNDRLLVLKSKSDKEKTIYFRIPTLVQATDISGNLMKDVDGNVTYAEQYTTTISNSSVCGINDKTISNFNGDTLFVDGENEVAGLDIEGIIGDTQRQANTRSYYIDHAIKDADLSDALLWASGRTLYLSVPSVGLFATDRDSKTSGQYEWWKLDGIDARCFFNDGDKDYYGTSDGKIYQLEDGEYSDSERILVGKGQMIISSADPKSNKITVSNSIMAQLGDDSASYLFQCKPLSNDTGSSYLYSEVLDMSDTKDERGAWIDGANNLIKVSDSVKNRHLGGNNYYYLNTLEGDTSVTSLQDGCDSKSSSSFYFGNYYTRYKLVEADYVDSDGKYASAYQLYGEDSTGAFVLTDLSHLHKAGLCKRLDGIYSIGSIDSASNTFKLYDNNGVDEDFSSSNEVNIVAYGKQTGSSPFEGEITVKKAIVSEFVTAPLLASMNYFKTIWQIDLANGSDKPSDLQVGYVSNKVPTIDYKKISDVSKAQFGLDLNDVSFNRIDLDKKLVPRAYTIARTLAHQRFVCVAFKSEESANSVLPELVLTYTVPFPSIGSD